MLGVTQLHLGLYAVAALEKAQDSENLKKLKLESDEGRFLAELRRPEQKVSEAISLAEFKVRFPFPAVAHVKGLSKAKTGLGYDDYYLYLRDVAKQQLRFFMDNSSALIEGSPGTGKSVVTWLFALWFAKSGAGSVLWCHFDKPGVVWASLITKHEITSVRYSSEFNTEANLLILDGVCNVDSHKDAIGAATKWREDGENRRIIVVTSQQLYIKPHVLDTMQLKEFQVLSWSFDDYRLQSRMPKSSRRWHRTFLLIQAMRICKNAFRVSIFWLEEVVGSCFNIQRQTIKSLDNSLAACSDVSGLLSNTAGVRSSAAVNTLLQTTANGSFLVSEYLARKVGFFCTASFIAQARALCPNDSFDGWIFEMDFMMQIKREGGLALKCSTLPRKKDDVPQLSEVFWPTLKMCNFFHDPFEVKGALIGSQWLLPKRWNQGGYDAIRIILLEDKTIAVEFIQVTAATHSFKSQYMNQMLDVLQANNPKKIARVNFFFLVPDTAMESLTPPRVDTGWIKKILLLGLKRTG